MAVSKSSSPAEPNNSTYRVVAAGVVGFVVGFFGSALTPLLGALIGGAIAAIGLVGYTQRHSWGAMVLTLGIGLVVGAAAYIVLGLVQSDGSASGSGSGSGTG